VAPQILKSFYSTEEAMLLMKGRSKEITNKTKMLNYEISNYSERYTQDKKEKK
jgi:hypothetical protein